MFKISDYLDKFTSALSDGRALKDSIVKVIYTVCGVNLDLKTVDVRDGAVYINATPIIKNEIFLKKQRILDKLEIELGSRKITEIR